MTILGIGVDVVDIPRFAASLERTPTLRNRLFTAAEADLPLESLAGRFAAKEAFVKALRAPAGMSWQDIEVVSDAQGAPELKLHGAALDRAAELGVTATHLSISHDTTVATAFVVAEC
ncbi:holo-ACP synthase [Aeromicrobium sp. SMF47]|uniref:Holo-[acyl-carrier-protein] synthase n=1 Tax=Aeromicrobium yanjiei TaxID=2662028 RepID=A0A5Q2MHH2_9ACTN|nr:MULTISPECIES: holo-ACP synthase [Aeromicrobium]MRJ76282.1 holo-ACP synthase [Aeromicrobium yanjiei]MRK00632.1 holo-ACP synthase [Aeromicrobium sp. S22]QGG42537.1 holo-ACP synthase [Aeromicrobium yanjiei]